MRLDYKLTNIWLLIVDVDFDLCDDTAGDDTWAWLQWTDRLEVRRRHIHILLPSQMQNPVQGVCAMVYFAISGFVEYYT